MKPPAPESALMVMETARMPGSSIAAMKPAALAMHDGGGGDGLAGDKRHAHHGALHRIVDAGDAISWVMKLASTALAGHFSQRT